jgi:putative pyruvate formate lyase activating enzyme
VEIYRHGAHHGEEPPLSGSGGSGTVFFSRCTLRCLYCQNYPWSQEGRGRTYTAEELAGIFRELRRSGCHNWNLVSPTPWLPAIRDAILTLRDEGIRLPVVYNTSGFENAETLNAVADWVDVYLTDLRYARPETAREGSGRADYVDTARAALRIMWEQKGALRPDKNGVALSGTICRILVLPNHADEAVDTLRWLADAVGTEIAVSVMAQYTPAYRAAACPGWDRRITEAEYETVRREVETLGFENGWVQEYEGPTPKELVGYEMRPGFQE